MHLSAHGTRGPSGSIGDEVAWALLRALARRASSGAAITDGAGVGLDRHGRLVLEDANEPLIHARPELLRGWSPVAPFSSSASELLDLYMPLCVGARSTGLVVAHLGQSVDHRIAADGGKPLQITGAADALHTHRLRALFDAVVVGAHTIASDDPRLTTRLVEGRSPTRVVIDPRQRLSPDHRVFTDRDAFTLRIVSTDQTPTQGVTTLAVPGSDDGLDLRALLAELGRRGLRRVFVEGGGETVRRFLHLGLLDRLQLVVAPQTLGAGPLGVSVQSTLARFGEDACRRIALGDDLLFDWDLSRVRTAVSP